MKKIILLLLLLNFFRLSSQSGELDTTFNMVDNSPYSNFNDKIIVTAIQSDGKIIIGGSFTTCNFKRIGRLNSDGSTDTGFNPGSGFDNDVKSICVQPDGKIIVVGNFISFNGVSRNYIARLNTDGSLDTGFDPGSGFDNPIYSVILQPDGKILVGGWFNMYNGNSHSDIVRLNSDGSIDNSFSTGTGFDYGVEALCLQSDGKIIVAGYFTTYNGTSIGNNVTRLNSDGSLDVSFNVGTGVSNNSVYTTAIQSDGKIILGGNFSTFNGTARNNIVRINTNGSLDTGFDPGSGFSSSVYSVKIQSDGKIIAGGWFFSFNGYTTNYVARLNSDGSIDTGFSTGTAFNSNVSAVNLQSDGKVIVVGEFTKFNGTVKNRIARLNSNGSLDTGFYPDQLSGFDGNVYTTAVQSDGKILVGGLFTSYQGVSRNNIARLNSDGSLDQSFNPGTGFNSVVESISLQQDGKIIAGGWFTSFNGTSRFYITRLNSNGSIDLSFNPGSGFSFIVKSTTLQGDGKIIVGGQFTSFNGTSRNYLARLNSDGSLDQSFDAGTSLNGAVNAICWQPDGKIIIGGSSNYIMRFNSNGSIDGGFSAIFDGSVETIIHLSNGKIMVGGAFIAYNTTTPRRRIALLNSNGSIDSGFNPGGVNGFNNRIESIAVQADGKVIAGGRFTSFNGIPVTSVARLNTDGTLDTGFNTSGSGFTGYINSLSLQSDNKIVVGGTFNCFNGKKYNRILRFLNFVCSDPNVAGTISGNQTICSGADPVAFTSTSPASGHTGTLEYKWQNSIDNISWSDIANTNSDTYDPPSGLTQTTWYRRLARVNCSPNWSNAVSTTAITVTVNPITSITAQSTASQTVCINGTFSSISVTATGVGLSYQWYSNTSASTTGGTAISGATSNAYTPDATTTGTTYYYAVVNGTCGSATTAVSGGMVVNPIPTPSASNTGPYCPGQTISFSATGGGTYSWSGPNSFTSTSQNPTIPNSTTAMGGNYTATVTLNGCTAAATTSVTVNPSPAATASNTGPYCPGQTISLSAPGGGSYSWSGPNAFVSANQNPTIPSATTSMGGNYTVTVTLNSCTSTATTSVTVNPNPAASASNNGPVCPGASISLFGNGGVNYSWVGPNGFISNQQNPIITNSSSFMSGSYTLTVTGSNGCSSSDTTIVNVNSNLNISVTLTQPSCGASNGSITATINGGSAPYNAQWSNGDFGLTADSLASGQYVVQVTDANGCYSSLTVNLNPSNGPSVTSTSQNNVTCNGSNNGSLALNINGGSLPINILWSNGATSPTVSNLTAGVYDVVLTDASGCVVNASYNVTEPDPIAVSFSTTPASCGNNDGSLSATVTGGTSPYNLQWSANAGSQTTPTASNLGNGIYSLTITDNANCTYSASGLVITSSTGPALSFSFTPSGGCAGSAQGSIDLTPSGGVSPYNFQWSNGSTNEDISNLSPGTYSVVVTGGDGCSSADTVVVANASGNTNPEICIVTVDSFTNTNKVIWEKPGSANGIKEYKIYREGSALNVYNLIKTLPFDSLSEYTDPVANPAVRAWRYKITYKDSCGVETVLSVNHKTIHLAVNVGISNTRNLAWDDYEGFPFLTFNIWRYHASTGWVKLDSLPSNLHSYTDLNPPGGGTLDYAIEVVRPNSCNSTRGVINTTRSNIRNIVAPLSTNIDELSLTGVKIFPNPTKNKFSIEVDVKENTKMSVTLFDVRGREVMQTQRVLTSGKNTETFNISELESGVYFISVQVEEKIFRTKLVKEN